MKTIKKLFIAVAVVCLLAGAAPLMAATNPDCEMPNVMILLDRSGSMEGSKWNAAVQAINSIVVNHDDKVRFGLSLFPGYGAGTCTFGGACKTDSDCSGWFNSCEVDSCSAGAIDVPIADTNSSQIVSFMNSAKPYGATPMAVSFKSLTTYQPLRDPLRRNFVLFVSDGEETCGGKPAQDAQNLANAGIKMFVIGFGSGVNPQTLNQLAQIGGTARKVGPPFYYQADSPQELNQAFTDIFISITEEVCDGLDNNCNGIVDENTDKACETLCGKGMMYCVAGIYTQCVDKNGNPIPAEGSEEICDGIDNNCDGQIDKDAFGNPLTEPCGTECESGVRTCIDGKWGECDASLPTPEICDGIDNNCDGQIDKDAQGNPLKRPCQNACGSGDQICTNGEWGPCSAGEPSAEVCDGIDNDCNGLVDDNIPGVGDKCIIDDPTLFGPCSEGVMTCEPSVKAVICKQVYFPQTEVCDFTDNNCDGRIDEGLRNACGLCSEVDVEICDGIDNNCDGKIDEGAKCPNAGEICHKGECVRGCPSGECPENYNCVNTGESGMRCVSICSTVECQEGAICDPKTGRCVDLCEGVKCGAGEKCSYGICLADNCYTAGCPSGERCVNGKCVSDPCENVKCEAGQFCRTYDDDPDVAYCHNSCDRISCRADQICKNGMCINDKCYGVECEFGSVCKEGECIKTDNCSDCMPGQDCVNGACKDGPCVTIKCPAGSVCVDGECQPPSGENPLPCDPEKRPLCCEDGQRAKPICINGQWDCGEADWGACPPPPECESDDDCPAGKVCYNGACVADSKLRGCQSHSDCKPNEKCVNGKCVDQTLPDVPEGDDDDDSDDDDDDDSGLPQEPGIIEDPGCSCKVR